MDDQTTARIALIALIPGTIAMLAMVFLAGVAWGRL